LLKLKKLIIIEINIEIIRTKIETLEELKPAREKKKEKRWGK